MKRKLSSRQMINVELAIRERNKNSKNTLKYHTPKEEQKNLTIAFLCECSDPNCGERIQLSLAEYEKLHRDPALFVIAKGHEEPKVEKVLKSNKKIAVVEKYALS